MRITLVISSLQAGGAERVLSHMADHWADLGEEITLITFLPATEDHYPLPSNVERICVPIFSQTSNPGARLVWQFRRHRHLRKAILATRPDAVISFVDKTNVRVLLSLWGKSIPVIVSERSNPDKWPISRAWQVLRKFTYRRASAVVMQTEAAAQWLHTNVHHVHSHVIANPVRHYDDGPATNREQIVLAVGRLSHEKGYDLLLRAWHSVVADLPQWRLMLLGDGEQKSELQALVDQLDLTQSVDFAGQVPDPTPYLRSASIFALPSRLEGFPNALLEAMAQGVAVASCDCDFGPRDIIQHETNGLLVPAGDWQALGQAIARLAASEDLRKRLGQRALEVRTRYALAEIMTQWSALVEQVIEDQQ